MSQKMIRVSEAAYWELKQWAAVHRVSVADVVNALLWPVKTPLPVPVPSVPASSAAPAVVDPGGPAQRVDLPPGPPTLSDLRAKAYAGPFSKASQVK